MRRWKRWVAAALSLLALAAPAPAQADPLLLGRRTAEAFFGGDVEAIWSAATPEMRRALRSVENLSALRDQLLADFGAEETILSERAQEQAGRDVYRRVSRWTETPAPLEIVITFDDAERIAGFVIRPQPIAAPSSYLDYQTKAKLRLPVEGDWFVYWGGRDVEDNYHAVDVGQRFALDLLIRRDGRSYAGDRASLESYHCWGRPILAPADGVVAQAVDGLPDQAIGSTDPAYPAGNHIVIDFGAGEYGILAHLRRESLRVAKGDAVTAGQEIAQCGNSGNTTEPHLHFHMQTSPELGQGVGLPAQFTNYRADGVRIDRGEPQKGEFVQPAE